MKPGPHWRPSRYQPAGLTGSVKTGINVATAAAQNVVPCVLELGGKSAALSLPDADLDAVMESIRWGIFFNAGQVCSAMSRVLAHQDVHDEIVDRAADLARSLSVGPGIDRLEFGANMGAMISEGQRDRAEAMCRDAVAAGAVAATGGQSLTATAASLSQQSSALSPWIWPSPVKKFSGRSCR